SLTDIQDLGEFKGAVAEIEHRVPAEQQWRPARNLEHPGRAGVRVHRKELLPGVIWQHTCGSFNSFINRLAEIFTPFQPKARMEPGSGLKNRLAVPPPNAIQSPNLRAGR